MRTNRNKNFIRNAMVRHILRGNITRSGFLPERGRSNGLFERGLFDIGYTGQPHIDLFLNRENGAR